MKKTAVLGLCALHLAACGTPTTKAAPKAPEAPEAPPPGAIATVNGRAVYVDDLVFRAKSSAHGTMSAEEKKNLLGPLIQNELLAQKAEALGLDDDPDYQKGLRRITAQLNSYRRDRLKDLVFRHQIKSLSPVSEADARRFYDADAERIQTELHVHQILRKGRASIDPIQKHLEAGLSFDDVLKKEYGGRPNPAKKPWDLGYLEWSQIPAQWKGVVDKLAPNEVSAVIPGPKNRFWIVRLVERRRNKEITFEREKERIMAILREEKRAAIAKKLESELQSGAQIRYFDAPR